MVYIKELFPNPEGPDGSSEWIRIENDGEEAVSLAGWRIEDASENAYELSGVVVEPKETIQLGIDLTGISLNNGGDKITLYDQSGNAIDSLGYTESVTEGEVVISSKLLSENQEGHLSASVVESGTFEPQNVNTLLVGLSIGLIAAVTFILLSKYLMKEDE